MSGQIHLLTNPELREQPAEVITGCDNVQNKGLGTITGDNGASTGSTHVA